MKTITPNISGIVQISINAHDLDRARAFYRDVLGLTHLFDAGNMAFFQCGGVRLMLATPEKPEFDHASSILYLKVDDIQAAHKAMEQMAVRFEQPPSLVAKMESYDLWMAFFRDSESNLLALMSEAARG